VDSPSRVGLDNKFPGDVTLVFRGQSLQVLDFAGSMMGGGDGAFGGVTRIDTLDLPQTAIIGQVEDQDKRTDEDYRGPHPTTFGQISVFTRLWLFRAGQLKYLCNRSISKRLIDENDQKFQVSISKTFKTLLQLLKGCPKKNQAAPWGNPLGSDLPGR